MLLVVSRKKRRPTARVVPAHVDAAHLATARHLATIQDHVRVSGLTHTAEEPVERFISRMRNIFVLFADWSGAALALRHTATVWSRVLIILCAVCCSHAIPRHRTIALKRNLKKELAALEQEVRKRRRDLASEVKPLSREDGDALAAVLRQDLWADAVPKFRFLLRTATKQHSHELAMFLKGKAEAWDQARALNLPMPRPKYGGPSAWGSFC